MVVAHPATMRNDPATGPGSRPRRIALVAGEASGDQLGAALVHGLKALWPDAHFAGVGGGHMRATGVELWSDYAPLAVMGLAEVLRHLPRLLRFRRDLVRRLLAWQPDVFIGIDAPDFNLGVERRLKRTGVRTVHYVSPSVWAWRRKRAQRMGGIADRVLCLFPMEPPIYASYGVDARFVGHPLADRFPHRPDREAARAGLGIEPGATVLGVLPGSRLGEIQRLAPVFLKVVQRLRRQRPGLEVLVPAANGNCRQALQTLLHRSGDPGIRLLDGEAPTVMVAADVLLLASGTAALEALLAKRPMLVAYRIAPLTHFLVKRLGMLRIERYSLPNILHGGELVPEFMQDRCTAEAITPALSALLDDAGLQARQVAGFDAIHEALRAPGGAAHAAAAAVAGLLEGDA